MKPCLGLQGLMGLKMVLLWQWRVALVLTREKEKLVDISDETHLSLNKDFLSSLSDSLVL